MEAKITFIIGGARSGKSSFALNEASKIKGQKAYIATAEAFDSEMKERIKRHKAERGEEWDTYEEPIRITSLIKEIHKRYDVLLVDCLTLWVSNLMQKYKQPEDEIDRLINILAGPSGSNNLEGLNIFIVANEVGMGIVPDNEIARRFRDLVGLLNQRVAEIADEVYLVTAGIPIQIKKIKNQKSKLRN